MLPFAVPDIAYTALGYVLGSIPFGLLLTRVAGLGDIRAIGSGNIGATNVLRTGRKGLAAATLLLDALKGAAAVLIAAALAGRDAALWAGLGAVLGHLFPVWLRFKGGKGVATGFGVFLVAAPTSALAAITVFALVLLTTRYVSLASILGAASFPLFAFILVHSERPPFFISVQFIVALLIIAKHHQNIRRLLAGTESRIGASSSRNKEKA